MSTTGKDGSEDFSAGDRITLTFDDAPGVPPGLSPQERATSLRFTSPDQIFSSCGSFRAHTWQQAAVDSHD